MTHLMLRGTMPEPAPDKRLFTTMKKKINKILSNHTSYLNNIEWTLGNLVGQAAIILKPETLNLQNVPKVISIDNLEIDGYQCLGISLLNKDRLARSNEIINSAKRSLICESLELTAEHLSRVARIKKNQVDPLDKEDFFSANIKELWNSKEGNSGCLLENDERLFFEKCASPLRHWIRHGNGKIPNKKEISYTNNIMGKNININQKWVSGKDNDLVASLRLAHDVFSVIRDISTNAIKSAVN